MTTEEKRKKVVAVSLNSAELAMLDDLREIKGYRYAEAFREGLRQLFNKEMKSYTFKPAHIRDKDKKLSSKTQKQPQPTPQEKEASNEDYCINTLKGRVETDNTGQKFCVFKEEGSSLETRLPLSLVRGSKK